MIYPILLQFLEIADPLTELVEKYLNLAMPEINPPSQHSGLDMRLSEERFRPSTSFLRT